jgi:hypothetical protein
MLNFNKQIVPLPKAIAQYVVLNPLLAQHPPNQVAAHCKPTHCRSAWCTTLYCNRIPANVFQLQRRPRWYTLDELNFWDDEKGAVFTADSQRLSSLGIAPTILEDTSINFVRHFRRPQHQNLIIE